MTVLTETLDRLEYWLWQNHPGVAELLEPGLTSEEIDNQVQDLPVQLTQEIKELYQWTNGCSVFALPFHDEHIAVMSLEDAIQFSYHQPYVASEFIMEKIKIPNLVIWREFEELVHFAVCDGDDSSPILTMDECFCTGFAYSSITTMALTTLEGYERGILTIGDGWNPRILSGTLRNEFKSICQQNNAAFNSDSILERYSVRD